MERRLAAIMVADVAGYALLIRVGEEGTIAALKALHTDLIDPKIPENHGRIVKLMSDGMLAEFASVVDAVHSTVEMQVHRDGVGLRRVLIAPIDGDGVVADSLTGPIAVAAVEYLAVEKNDRPAVLVLTNVRNERP
jgi:class 3 adenylate cyclase